MIMETKLKRGTKKGQNLGAKNGKAVAVECMKLGSRRWRKYGAMREAARDTGVQYSNISAACDGRIRQTGGYFWRRSKQ